MSEQRSPVSRFDALQTRARELAEYSGTPAMKAAVGLLEALEASYLQDLVAVEPENLRALQRVIKQLRQLKRIANGDAATNGRT